MIKLFVIFSLSALVAGCASQRERLFGAGGQSAAELPYRAKLIKGDDRRNITISVRAGGSSVDAVRETVRFQATSYCLSTFGGSDTRWATDPATNDWAFTRSGDDMIFTGRCVAR